ncbi:MAG TPA: hypothetical protein VGA56_13630 [Opitutaceae bacterium]
MAQAPEGRNGVGPGRDDAPPLERSLPWALACLSAGVTAAQVALMQVLACVQWYHFAYLVVSVALLGFGASGTVLSLFRERLLAVHNMAVPWLMAASGAVLAGVIALLQAEWLRFDLYLLFVDGKQWVRLTAASLLLAMPFFLAGLAVGLVLTAGVARAGTLYFANMAGSGVGAMGGLLLLEMLEPAGLPALVGIAPATAALLVWLGRRDRLGLSAGCAIVIGAIVTSVQAPGLIVSPFKDLARTMDMPGARFTVSEPGAQGWLQVVDAPALRGGPPASLGFSGRIPRQQMVFIDGNNRGSILVDRAPDALDVFAASPEALPWKLGSPRRVLLLHEGAGGHAAFALDRGAGEVVLVEPHRDLARLLDGRLSSGLAVAGAGAARVSVEVVTAEPREILERASSAYDLIRIPTVGSFGGSAGLQAVAEEFLLTREAIAASWRALTSDGMLLVSAWMDHPERTPLRLAATLREGLLAAQVDDVRAHLVAVRGWAAVTFLVRRASLGAADIEAVRAFCGEHGFDPLILPGLGQGERDYFHAWSNPDFFRMVDAIVDSGGEGTEVEAYPFHIDAPTDGRPYFSQFLRPRASLVVARTHGLRGMPFFELGSIIVAVTLVVLVVLAAVLILLPLVRLGWRGARRGWTLGYFAALGAGFMLLEIGLMMRLALFAGGPVPAAAVVLATMLFAAGAGSRVSQRFAPNPRALVRITMGAAFAAVLLGWLTGRLPVGWDGAWLARAAVCALLISPAAFLLGQAFPTGLRFLAAQAPLQVPWAWAINGCVSVVTPSVATLLAVLGGHASVFWAAAGAYLLATLVTVAGGRMATTTSARGRP